MTCTRGLTYPLASIYAPRSSRRTTLSRREVTVAPSSAVIPVCAVGQAVRNATLVGEQGSSRLRCQSWPTFASECCIQLHMLPNAANDDRSTLAAQMLLTVLVASRLAPLSRRSRTSSAGPWVAAAISAVDPPCAGMEGAVAGQKTW